jgi:hypothetical protein
MEKKYTAEEIMAMISKLDNSQRWELLDKVYDKYYNKGDIPKNEDGELDY